MPLDEPARRRLVVEATLTAAAVGLGFLLIGDAVLSFLGVTVGDFQVAGGLLLLVLSIYELIHPELPPRQLGTHPGVVPLGIPMIVGPADDPAHCCPDPRLHCDLDRLCAEPGDRLASAKVFNLVPAAIAVTFVRRGVMAALTKP